MPVYIYWIFYLIIINLTAILATVTDKRHAERRLSRVPERTLLLIAVLGGSPAMLITMKQIHHKTHRKKFMMGIPSILLVQAVLCWALFR